jgi:hypothetical protein
MDALDDFSLTIQPAAAHAGVETSAVSRHLPIFRRCVGQRDTPVLVARCSSADPRPRGTVGLRLRWLLLATAGLAPLAPRARGGSSHAAVLALRTLGRRRRREMLLLTRHRLVVTAERGLLRRLRLYLNCDLRDLGDVTWIPEPARGGIRLAATAVDGVREHFWLDAGSPDRVRHLDAMLRQLFGSATATA